MKSATLLIEFLTEELPPSSLNELGNEFGRLVAKELKEKNLVEIIDMKVFSTPRRLGVKILNVLEKAPTENKMIKLMPSKIGFDDENKPTQALLKKLQSLNESDKALKNLKEKNENGQQNLYLPKNIIGLRLEDVLSAVINNCINQLPIKKMMTYQLDDGWTSVNFVRPVKNLLVLHGKNTLKVYSLGFTSNNKTYGHRFESKEKILTINHADNYEKILFENGRVITNFKERKEKIRNDINTTLKSFKENIHIIDDEALLDEITALVEMPNILIGSFDKKFLKVPQACLILTMKSNQKYFPLFDKQNNLTQYFIIVSNLTPKNSTNIIEGNEKVIKPRLADAEFFFNQDKRKSLKSLSKELNTIVYHNKLGTQEDRAERVSKILKYISSLMGFKNKINYKEFALLAKADLLSLMVGEFPELQGIMGSIYASNTKEYKHLASAIEDHYKPKFSGDSLPRDSFGDYAALAEKFEVLIGLFSINEQPTGDKDPFSLRRNAIGIIRILIEKNIAINFIDLIDKNSPKSNQENNISLKQFIYERLSNYLKEKGYKTNEIDAVISSKPQFLNNIIKKLDAIQKFIRLEQSQTLASSNKRVSNILKKFTGPIKKVDKSLLCEKEEIKLFNSINELDPILVKSINDEKFFEALNALVELKEPIDQFFENVMVNSENQKIKNNRHNLLKQLHISLNHVADISKLAN